MSSPSFSWSSFVQSKGPKTDGFILHPIFFLTKNMDYIPEPPILTLDPNDENIILAMPEDRDPRLEKDQEDGGKKEKVKTSEHTYIYVTTVPTDQRIFICAYCITSTEENLPKFI